MARVRVEGLSIEPTATQVAAVGEMKPSSGRGARAAKSAAGGAALALCSSGKKASTVSCCMSAGARATAKEVAANVHSVLVGGG